MFPFGYQLHDTTPLKPSHAENIPKTFQLHPLRILISPSRVSSQLQQNLKKAFTALTGIAPVFVSVPLEELDAHLTKGDADIYVGTVGLADPDPEGAMSYYLETKPPTIATIGNDFLKRLDLARKQADPRERLRIMRSILSDAVCEGYLLPMFHLSTIAIARPELDLSAIPDTDESATLSKIKWAQ